MGRRVLHQVVRGTVLGFVVAGLAACSGDGGSLQAIPAESCMSCHNSSLDNDYTGPGIENPHPFPGADNLLCTTCHGGNPNGENKDESHVPRPPEIGTDQNLIDDETAYFNRLTLTGFDKFADYSAGGATYSPLDYLQFINPGDLRVVTQGRSCGECHEGHAECVSTGLLATAAGMLSGAMYAAGVDNQVPASIGAHEDTAADLGFRAVSDPDFPGDVNEVGTVGQLLEFPVFSEFGGTGQADDLFESNLYLAADMNDDVDAQNRLIAGSPLANVYHEQVAFTCGDCHLGSAGANNRAGDYRSSGCTSCHMPYSLGGRSGSLDPNVPKNEPQNPDNIRAPERAHVASHRIASVAKTLPNGVDIEGISDYACAGCHQGSNRTVMQYWGIRLDQNEDLENGFQYPLQPISFVNTEDDERLFPSGVNNHTFNGRDDEQYILFEDYDGDNRDDTPADVHYEAGMGCIDCHGSFDLHGGDVNNPGSDRIPSRMEQAVSISCQSCHGTASSYAATTSGTTYDGSAAEVGVDEMGNPLRHVVKESDGYYLYSRLTGDRHYLPQTRDTVVDTGVIHPVRSTPIYSDLASYAMGRADGNDATGIGPIQDLAGPHSGFAHADTMDCASCHASWTNTCMGCHLEGEYRDNENQFFFSNITGDRIAFRERNADFVYQSPIPFQLGVNSHDKITQMSANTKTFFKYEDRQNKKTKVFAFTDRNGGGNNGADFPSLSHNAMMAHSIRGKVTTENEGPRYCVACHLTDEGLTNYGEAKYNTFRANMAAGNFGALDFNELALHIGRNPSNQMNSPLWVHMVAGLGSGLFLFDDKGAPVNPLDTNPQRAGTNNQAPASNFDPADVVYNLDRIVEEDGSSTGSSNHPLLQYGAASSLRDGAANPNLAGPLGATLLQRLADPAGIVLDAWIDANGDPGGTLPAILAPGP